MVDNIFRLDEKRSDKYKHEDCLYEQALYGHGIYDTPIYSFLKNHYVRAGRDISSSIVGLKLAFKVYRQRVDETGGLQSGLLLESKGKQFDNQFFISAAQTYCMSTYSGNSDFHTANPGYFQVNHAVMNNKYFHETFNCKDDDRMKPKKMCFQLDGE